MPYVPCLVCDRVQSNFTGDPTFLQVCLAEEAHSQLLCIGCKDSKIHAVLRTLWGFRLTEFVIISQPLDQEIALKSWSNFRSR